jgi:hypothetical protein
MTLASFRDLCVKAEDAIALATFWEKVLHGTLVVGEDTVRVDVEGWRVWFDSVPEPHPGQTRLHLDLRLPTADPAPLVAAGARLRRSPDENIHWWVLADPEGSEFCAFAPPHEGSDSIVDELVTASADPVPLARWWAGVLGGTVTETGYGADLTGAAGFPWRTWVFDRVADARVAPNRWHWDIALTDPDVDRGIAALESAGATLHRPRGGDLSWWVLTDPDGNDFCAFAPSQA